ncbi:HET-domain-containing protein [Daldinia decipiens]|uniref:HET-domain-containing protein n=1 Tax=Daldinia decipiens TaxID=326647 RepID=UPI0020C4E525|nr:HET-domain-containing protein [Daldinia decipiens]KAI1661755.1 HET-domain-containing protein [Daldinia decipiens]
MDSKNLTRTPISSRAPQETITGDKTGSQSVPKIQLIQADLGWYGQDKFCPSPTYLDRVYPSKSIRTKVRIQPNYATSANINGTRFARYISPDNILPVTWTYMDQLFDASSKWAQNQISDCINSHGECRQVGKDVPFIPSRLINVSIGELGEDVVLEDDTSIFPGSAYAALSYCWGGYDPDCMTTADSLEENMRRIPWSKLPATFKDAVRFTRSLDIKYLWIDCICIVQHDKRDWHRQAGLMWDIYKYSHVTLTALYGSSSKSGLRSTSMKNELTKVAELSLNDHRWPIYTRLPHYLQTSFDPDSSKEIEKRSPLLSRAWAYQERMISPRVLYFTESEIIFQCFAHSACECGALKHDHFQIQKPSVIGWGQFYMFENESWRALDSTLPDDDAWQLIAATWRDHIVKEYSGLLLTKPEDRLVALGAMTKQFQKLRPCESYFAGLWIRSLVEDLLWRCSILPFKENRGILKEALRRPYSLPTWSWASLQSDVDFPRLRLWFERIVVATVSEASFDYDGHSYLGRLIKSLLKLRGKLMPGMVEWHNDTECSISIPHVGNWASLMNSKDTTYVKGNYLEKVHMDHDDDGYQCIPRRQKVYLLWMFADFKATDEETMIRYYLILRREEEDKNVFSRVGIMEYTAEVHEDLWDIFNTAKRYKDAWRILDEHSVMTECEIR